jgi:Gpi18-like mannosyltransferase
MPSLRFPVHRIVIYYYTQFESSTKKYISPTPLISLATHLIIEELKFNDDKKIFLNNTSLDDSSLTKMWIDIARMQGSGVGVIGALGPGSFKTLTSNFEDYYKALSLCIRECVPSSFLPWK